MNLKSVDQIADAVLYEGYILYPYRASAIKNRGRFNFGTLYPPSYSEASGGLEPCRMRSECLIQGPRPELEIRVRFLHPVDRQVYSRPLPAEPLPTDWLDRSEPVASLQVDDVVHQSWQEVVERELVGQQSVVGATRHPQWMSHSYPATSQSDPIRDRDDTVAGMVVRRQQRVDAAVEFSAEPIGGDLFKLTVTIHNQTALVGEQTVRSDDLLLQSLASTHIVLTAADGEFVSLLDPPQRFADAAATCINHGCFPVLVGEPPERTTMLVSPIILYDYPQIAPESDGDFFDGTEIDEMLALRVMTLTDDEKRHMRGVDQRAQEILRRSDRMSSEGMMKLHGTMREVERE